MSKIKKNLWRHVLQLGVIAVIAGFILKVFFGGAPADVEAYCPFGGLQSLVTYLNSNTLACSMSIVQIMMGVTLAIGVILFSKLFCGYLCPLGTVKDEDKHQHHHGFSRRQNFKSDQVYPVILDILHDDLKQRTIL